MYQLKIEKNDGRSYLELDDLEGPAQEKDMLLTATLTAPTVPNCHISGLIPFNSLWDASSNIAPI